MGEEISYSRFNKTDYQRYQSRLQQETELLREWFVNDSFSALPKTAGYELEAWLIDRNGHPAPVNEEFLRRANNDLLCPELAQFNFELNVTPSQFRPDLLSHFNNELDSLWHDCERAAGEIQTDIIGIGILPTLRDEDLTLENISTLDRYRALNEQVLRQRKGVEIELNINGTEHLQVSHKDVMLEAAATSLQIHLQVPQQMAARYYNSSVAISSFMVAISANSPSLFGKRLWQESRIPVFEQSVPTGGIGDASHGPVHRVSAGSGFIRDSVFECFQENLEHYPVLLPVHYEDKPERMSHLRLHNGTIWRWNRPLIGFDTDGTPHLRIEHRVCAAAPSVIDNIANIAFYYGLVEHYANSTQPPESHHDFAECKQDFYRAAQLGIKHTMKWLDARSRSIQQIILDDLLPLAESGLGKLGLHTGEIKHYLSVIEQRALSGQTGSQWQQDFLNTHHDDNHLLTLNYLHNQQQGQPVHEWDIQDHTHAN